MISIILASLLWGSSLAGAVTNLFIKAFHLNFFASNFSQQIPSFSSELGVSKTYDIVNFGLFILISLTVFLVNLYFQKSSLKESKKENNLWLYDLTYLVLACLFFIQTHFIVFPIKQIFVSFVVIQTFYLIAKRFGPKELRIDNLLVIGNGFIMGFYLLLLTRQIVYSFALPIAILLTASVVYILFQDRFKRFFESPFHLLLSLSILFPLDIKKLLVLGIGMVIIFLLAKKKEWQLTSWQNNLLKIIYPAVLITLVVYNPLFYFENFDSVEEGIWLGWLERLLRGQSLYKDATVYQPPLMAWGLSLFVRLTDISIYNVRLFLHILQILGFIVYYFFISRVVKSFQNRFLLMFLAIGITSSFVKNNIEIRLAMGLIALLPLYFYYQTRKAKWLLISGILSALSLFTSLEVGIPALICVLLGSVLIKPYRLAFKGFLTVLAGFVIGSLPVLAILLKDQAFLPFIQQVYFYSSAFSSGYLNIALEQPDLFTLVRWWKIIRYLSSEPWLWELSRIGLVGGIFVAIFKITQRKFQAREKLVFITSIFGLFLFRVALGRSDFYHLLFPLMVALVVIFYALEELTKKIPSLIFVVWILFVFVFAHDVVNDGFLTKEVFKLQSYANTAGIYQTYNAKRSKIFVDKDVNVKTTNDLVEFIDKNTGVNDKIFAFPWMPEIYFLADRVNATSFDIPYSFFTKDYQRKMITELSQNPSTLVIYNSSMRFGNLGPDSLSDVNLYLQKNYNVVTTFGEVKILKKI